MIVMENNRLKERLDQLISQMKENSIDKEKFDKQVDSLLSVKGQLDVVPTRMYIPEKDVVKEYNEETYRVIKCVDCIIWQHKGGREVVIHNRMKAEYEFLCMVLEMRDNYNTLTEEYKNICDSLFFGYSMLLQLPMFLVSNEEYFVKAVRISMKVIEKMVKEALSADLQEETYEKNAEFETKMEVANELLKEDAGSK